MCEGYREIERTARFTLIELLVVIAIIGILASMLMPALSKAKYTAKNSSCISQIKQTSLGILTYASDSDDRYPAGPIYRRFAAGIMGFTDGVQHDLRTVIKPYVNPLNKMLKCPLADNWWRDSSNGVKVDFESGGHGGWMRTTYAFYFNDMTIPMNTLHWGYSNPVVKVGDRVQPTAAMAEGGSYNVFN